MILHDDTTIDHYRKAGLWEERSIDDVFRSHVATYPTRPAVVDAPNRAAIAGGASVRLTYRELDHWIDAVGAALLERGIRRDSIVVVQLPNTAELLACYLACARIGAIISPLPMQFDVHEYRGICAILKDPAALVLADRYRGDAFAEPLAARLADAGIHVPTLRMGEDMPAPGDHDGGRALASGIAGGNDIFTICWTSGTTADPKGVPLSHNNWLLYGRIFGAAAKLRDGEGILSPFPLVNFSGVGVSLLAWLQCAGTLHLHHPFDMDVFLAQLATEDIGFAVAPPALLNQIVKEADLKPRSLRTVMSGSAALSGAMIRSLAERGIELINGFGANEGVTLTSGSEDVPDPEARAELFPRIGTRAIPARRPWHNWIETRLADPKTGVEVTTPGDPGELLVRSGVVFPGYFGRPDLSAEAFTDDGFYRTGDRFAIAEDETGQPSFYRFLGRYKNLVVRGGMKIAPEELAALLETHPKILEVDVAAYPDPVVGEKACALVVPRSGSCPPTLEELVTHLSNADVARFKWVEKCIVVDELPRNAMGKVDRRKLADIARGN